MDRADDGETVLRLVVANGVSTGEECARRTHLLVGGGKYLGEHVHGQLFRERRDRQGEQRRPAHGEDIVEGIRGGDRPVIAGIVDDRREEIECEDERPLVVEAVDGGIVRRGEPDEQVLGLGRDEAGEQLLQASCRVLGGASATRGEIGELDGSDGDVHGSPHGSGEM